MSIKKSLLLFVKYADIRTSRRPGFSRLDLSRNMQPVRHFRVHQSVLSRRYLLGLSHQSGENVSLRTATMATGIAGQICFIFDTLIV